MFHRRLLLLTGAVLVPMVALGARLGGLTLADGDRLRDEAFARLVTERWLPTTRGSIVDRYGRPIASDRPGLDVAIDYPVITGRWAESMAASRARRIAGPGWGQMAPSQRRELIDAQLPVFQARLDEAYDELARLAGVSRASIDQRRREVQEQVESLAEHIWQRREQQWQRDALERGRDIADLEPDETLRRPIAEQQASHVIIADVGDEAGFRIMGAIERDGQDTRDAGRGGVRRLPGMHVIDASERQRALRRVEVTIDATTLPQPIRRDGPVTIEVIDPLEPIVGSMRSRVFAEDIARRPRVVDNPDGSTTIDRGHYMIGDSVGHTGLEASCEDELRGLRGLVSERLDTGEVRRTDPTPGKDIRLTIDAMLQARVQAVLQPDLGLTVVQPYHVPHADAAPLGSALAASVVVLDIHTGEILALVSWPTPGATDPRLGPVLEHASTNRAIAKPYPPGSIMKPLALVAARSEGVLAPGERIECTGHFLENRRDILRCWTYRPGQEVTHEMILGHALSGSDAVMASCNIFFYECGARLGPENFAKWLARFGLGAPFGLGVGPEFPGATPAPGNAGRQDAIMMAIGQGPVAWTPLHAAGAYATLARRGEVIPPHLRADDDAPTSFIEGIDTSAIDEALDGMRRSASEPVGTTHHIPIYGPDGRGIVQRLPIFTLPGIDVWAKSGTAQAPLLFDDLNDNGRFDEATDVVLRKGDHSWCVAMAGLGGSPRYVVSCVVEYAGSGGRVAGPIVNQVFRALIDEGYLPHIEGAPGQTGPAREVRPDGTPGADAMDSGGGEGAP